MSQQYNDIESAELRASNAFIESLAEGNLQAAAQKLRQLKCLERPYMEVLADVLDGNPSNLFQWRIVVQRPRRGRPAQIQKNNVKQETKQFDTFLNALRCGDTGAAAYWLRAKGNLHPAELMQLADHLDDPYKKLPWRLVAKQRRRGTPSDPLQKSPSAFVRSMLVDMTGIAKIYAAVETVKEKTGLSRTTIQNARRDRRHKNKNKSGS